MVHILYVGTNPEMCVVVQRILNANENWKGTVVTSAEEAITAVRNDRFDMVLFGSGLTENTEASLKTDLLQLDPNLRIALHYGGGSGLLKAEIESALASRSTGTSNGLVMSAQLSLACRRKKF